MSDDAPKEDRTEDPSGKRLQQAGIKGDIPIGKDLAMAASLAAGAYSLVMSGPALRDALVRLVAASAQHLHTAQPLELLPLVVRPALLAGSAVGASALAAILVLALQTKGAIWPEKVMPDFGRVFSMGKFGQLFSREFFKDLGVGLVKLVAIGIVLWMVFHDAFVTLPRLLTATPGDQLASLFGPLADGLVKILTVLVAIAGIDLALTKRKFKERLKMTKEEVRREHKDDEGDPWIKGKRRRRHRELAKGLINLEVPRADALIVNPTHIAIAVRYRVDEDRAPRVTAKGKGQVAELMRDLARSHGIPIVENIPLARLLYRKVKVGRTVPAETFKAVAAVLAFVYRVLNRNGASPGARQ